MRRRPRHKVKSRLTLSFFDPPLTDLFEADDSAFLPPFLPSFAAFAASAASARCFLTSLSWPSDRSESEDSASSMRRLFPVPLVVFTTSELPITVGSFKR